MIILLEISLKNIHSLKLLYQGFHPELGCISELPNSIVNQDCSLGSLAPRSTSLKPHDCIVRDWNPNPEKEKTDLLCGKLTWQDWKIGHFHIFHFTPSKGFFVTGEFSLPKMCLDADVFEG